MIQIILNVFICFLMLVLALVCLSPAIVLIISIFYEFVATDKHGYVKPQFSKWKIF